VSDSRHGQLRTCERLVRHEGNRADRSDSSSFLGWNAMAGEGRLRGTPCGGPRWLSDGVCSWRLSCARIRSHAQSGRKALRHATDIRAIMAGLARRERGFSPRWRAGASRSARARPSTTRRSTNARRRRAGPRKGDWPSPSDL
jgi:hypothetical protein